MKTQYRIRNWSEYNAALKQRGSLTFWVSKDALKQWLETTKQLVKETILPLPAQPGQPERVDYEYERNGTANLFMLCEPIMGWRHVEVTERRTAIDYAHQLKNWVDGDYSEAIVITIVQDNLNTHSPASLYKAFEPAEAQRILGKLEFCYSPKRRFEKFSDE